MIIVVITLFVLMVMTTRWVDEHDTNGNGGLVMKWKWKFQIVVIENILTRYDRSA